MKKESWKIIFPLLLISLVCCLSIFWHPGTAAQVPATSATESPSDSPTEEGFQYPDSYVESTLSSEDLDARIEQESTLEPGGGEVKDAYTQRQSYVNKTISCTFASGGRLTVGVDTDYSDAIILNPVYENTAEEVFINDETTKFGFYITDLHYVKRLESSESEYVKFNDTGDTRYTENKFFFIADQTYDTLLPCSYLDDVRYGLRWTDIGLNLYYDQTQDLKQEFEIRVVRFPDCKLMGCATLCISCSKEDITYEITGLSDSDVSVTGLMSDEDRDRLIEEAYQFFLSDDKGFHTQWDTSLWDAYKPYAMVSKVHGLSFRRIFSSSGKVLHSSDYSTVQDWYQVNLYLKTYCTVTVYFAPEAQTYRFSSDPMDDLVIVGSDALTPFSKEMIQIPDSMVSEWYS